MSPPKRTRTLRRRVLDAASRLLGRYAFDFAGGADRAIWVVGDGRSGTTWVANLFNYDRRCRILFEPCHPTHVADARRFGHFHYAGPDDPDPPLKSFYDRVFAGRMAHKWVDRYNSRTFYRRRVIKDIFANLFLKWAVVRYPKVRKILVVRHPFSVAVSKRKRRDWLWPLDPGALLEQPGLVRDFLDPCRDVVRSARSDFEKQVVIWAVAHGVPFRQLAPGDVHLVFHEHLVSRPWETVGSLFAALGEPAAGHPLDDRLRAQLQTPSQTSGPGTSVRGAEERLTAWRRELTASEIGRGVQILGAFGLDGLYGTGLMPDEGAIPIPPVGSVETSAV